MNMMIGKDCRTRRLTVKTFDDAGQVIDTKEHDLSATDYDYGTALVCEDVRKAIDAGLNVAVKHEQ